MSKDFVPYLNVTTHLDDTVDKDLFSAKGGTGFPTLFFFEPETGAVLNDWWWPGDEETVRDMLAQATAKAAELKRMIADAAAKPDDKAVQAGLQIRLALMRASQVPLDELLALSKTAGLDPAVKAEFDAWYAGALVNSIMEEAGEKAESRNEWMDLCAEGFYGLMQDGLRLPIDHDSAQIFYEWTMNPAISVGDVKIATAAFEGFRDSLLRVVESRPEVKDQVDGMIAAAKEKVDGIEPAGGDSKEE